MPARGMEILKSWAISGKKPIGENSVVPMAKAPMASASNGKLIFISGPSLHSAATFAVFSSICAVFQGGH